jgi:uncharacterized membrane protein YkgB
MNGTEVRQAATWSVGSAVERVRAASTSLQWSGDAVLRYGLAAIVLWFGLFKFMPTEAQAIQPLVAHSPFLSWLYGIMDVRGVSRAIGVAEILIAVLIALRPVARTASALGSLGAVAMFLTTLSFLFTTPGMWARVDGLVVPAGAGPFVIKDVVLLGAALYTAADALRSVANPRGAAAS